MIKLRKLRADDPRHGANIAWLAQRRVEYRLARLANEPSTVTDRFLPLYRDPRVKEAILAETFGKCAYCESKYIAVTWGDVEHILPRAADPERQLDYDNLTLACSVCNNAKSNKEYADGMGLLNPYADDPEAFLFTYGAMFRPLYSPAERVRAMRTIDDVKLNRPGLLEARQEFFERCDAAIYEFENAPNEPLRDYARKKIADMQLDTAEYAFVARAIFRAHFGNV